MRRAFFVLFFELYLHYFKCNMSIKLGVPELEFGGSSWRARMPWRTMLTRPISGETMETACFLWSCSDSVLLRGCEFGSSSTDCNPEWKHINRKKDSRLNINSKHSRNLGSQDKHNKQSVNCEFECIVNVLQTFQLVNKSQTPSMSIYFPWRCF